jgi:hypothetical protein
MIIKTIHNDEKCRDYKDYIQSIITATKMNRFRNLKELLGDDNPDRSEMISSYESIVKLYDESVTVEELDMLGRVVDKFIDKYELLRNINIL